MSLYAVAMSGGVDSSVTASLLREQKHDVVGFTMLNYDDKPPFRCNVHEKMITDAQKVCQKLGIPHHVIDLRKEFREIVVQNFIDEYMSGRTPCPCTLCNHKIKFGLFVEKIKDILKTDDFLLATGHYATIDFVPPAERGGEGGADLKAIYKAKNTQKDQTYMLWGLKQSQIQKTIFPLHDFTDKNEVRKLASQMGLEISQKKDSQDICFLEGKYIDFLNAFIEQKPGDLVFEDKKVIGRHKGLAFYTLGQRKGLVSWHSPLYVQALDKEKNAVIVTDDLQKLQTTQFYIKSVNWQQNQMPTNFENISVQIRYNSHPQGIKELIVQDKRVLVVLQSPATSITPGQSAVFYEGERLLGGGVIIGDV